MKKLGKHEKELLLLFIVVALGVASLLFIVSRINEVIRSIDRTAAEISAENLKRVKYQNLMESYQEIIDETNQLSLSGLLPNTAQFVKVIEEMEEIAAKTGNSVVIRLGETRLSKDAFEVPLNINANQDTIDAKNGLNYIEVEVTARGDFPDTLRFVKMLKESRYFLNIDSMRLNRTDVAGDFKVDAYFVVRIYVQKVVIK